MPTFNPTAIPSLKPSLQSTPERGVPIYPAGVQINYPVSLLHSFGCSVCYFVSYGIATSISNVQMCTGPYIFVGALAWSSSENFVLGAFAPQQLATAQTPLNNPNLINGVYWYLTPSNSFGFSDVYTISQNSCDTTDPSDNYKLCWHLDQGVGGFRAGSTEYLNSDSTYQKVIYNCPSAVPTAKPTAPSKQPTAKPTAPSKQPTAKPTAPSKKPTAKPTAPSKKPTLKPTAPSKKPTAKPTAPSKKPTAKPIAPSRKPTAKPTAPSKKPTAKPTAPSKKPTSNPTNKLSGFTLNPSTTPTNRLAFKPTTKPTRKYQLKPSALSLETDCAVNCKRCNSQKKCTSCAPGYYLRKYKCKACHKGCKTCDSSSSCLSCESGLYLYQGNCGSFCPDGTYGLSGVCTACLADCASCKNGYDCSSCSSGFFYSKGKCAACSLGCYLCDSPALCLSCQPGFFFVHKQCIASSSDEESFFHGIRGGH